MSDAFFKDFHYACLDATQDFPLNDLDEDAVTITDAVKGKLQDEYPQAFIRVETAKELLTIFGDENPDPNNGYFVDFFIREGRLVYRKGGRVNQAV